MLWTERERTGLSKLCCFLSMRQTMHPPHCPRFSQSFYVPPSPSPSPAASPSPGEANVAGTSPPPSSGSNGGSSVQVWVWAVVGVCAGLAIVAGG